MKRILVPTDFSDRAGYALDFACEIALKHHAKLLIIHTVEHPFGGGIDPAGASIFQSFDDDYINTLSKRGRDKMEKIVSQLPIPTDEITQLVEIGHAPTLVADIIREYSIDLVVMGTHGASGIREMFVGSNAEKIVRSAPCPVITLKTAVQLAEIKKMAFASDFARLDKGAMTALKRMQEVFGVDIDFVRINTPNNFQRDVLTKRHMHDLVVKEMFLKSSLHIYNDYSEQEGLLHFAEEMKSDMIGMLTHGRSGLNHMMSGSIAEDVVNHINLPVWTMRIPD